MLTYAVLFVRGEYARHQALKLCTSIRLSAVLFRSSDFFSSLDGKMRFLALASVASGLLDYAGAANIKREESQSVNSSAYDFVSYPETAIINLSSFNL